MASAILGGIIVVAILAAGARFTWDRLPSAGTEPCKPAGWVASAVAELGLLIPKGASNVDVDLERQDCERADVPVAFFALKATEADVETLVAGRMMAAGWRLLPPGRCLSKRIDSHESYISLEVGGDGYEWQMYVEILSQYAAERVACPHGLVTGPL